MLVFARVAVPLAGPILGNTLLVGNIRHKTPEFCNSDP
jgi:hypothetical protein